MCIVQLIIRFYNACIFVLLDLEGQFILRLYGHNLLSQATGHLIVANSEEYCSIAPLVDARASEFGHPVDEKLFKFLLRFNVLAVLELDGRLQVERAALGGKNGALVVRDAAAVAEKTL